jgi:NAD+ synthase (glutamine-hydrolysing)
MFGMIVCAHATRLPWEIAQDTTRKSPESDRWAHARCLADPQDDHGNAESVFRHFQGLDFCAQDAPFGFDTMRIALAQINPTIGDFQGNMDKVRTFVDQAAAAACDLVVFSELVISGYPPRDFLEQRHFVDENLRRLNHLVDTVKGIGVICGFVDENPTPEGHPLRNGAVLFESGRILHRVHKRLLPNYDVFDESRYFEPSRECLSFLYKGKNIGLTICEDIWNDKDLFPRRLYSIDPVAEMIRDGANLIINISSSPFHVGKREFKEKMLANLARKYAVPLVYVNQVGGNDSLLFDGMSVAYDAAGRLAARAKDFEEDMVFWDTEMLSGTVRPVAETPTESVLKALVMGTRDYVHKCGFTRAVIGLSGGIDSVLTAAIAVRALGQDNVTGIFMPSPYTSHDNFEDTTILARRLGITFHQLPISDLFEALLKALSPFFQGIATEVTGQNLQARIRGTLLMAFSNKQDALLLATGNKSEMAVGYCTLYGDMCGGLAVISDVPKTMVYQLAALINHDQEVIPQRVLEKAPSAELRPGQKDQDDLPPYDILDGILRAYVEDGKGEEEIVAMGFEAKMVKETVCRIVRNEYKRHQAPPGLKVTTKSFGYGRRYPMAQKITAPN